MPTDKPLQSDSSEEEKGAVDQIKPIPDEDGPHDVPDETVIEKTLPATGSVDKDGKAS
jgi:hypothetical protein